MKQKNDDDVKNDIFFLFTKFAINFLIVSNLYIFGVWLDAK